MLDASLKLSTALVALLIGSGVAALYVFLAVPRLRAAPWLTSGLLTVVLGIALIAPPVGAFGLCVAVVSVLIGHVAWWWGRQGIINTLTPKVGSSKKAKSSSLRHRDAALTEKPLNASDIGARTSSSASEASSRPDRTQLGRYRIERQIGRGSMGAVYAGMDPKVGRAVALKTLALGREFEGDEFAEARSRFFREAETAGRLQHRDIVTIYDAGEENGLAYIAMEFLSGTDLQNYTQPDRLLPVAVVLRYMARVALALHYAHSQGVVHRDIKPANVMVDLAADTVKVTDFGIARISAEASRTRTGLVLGSPSFMSPEQMAGQRVDGRSDLYSLGAMLFQLLTGRLPHKAESMAQLMYQIANEVAPDIRIFRPELPESLAEIVSRAMEKRPEARFPDGQSFATALQQAESQVLQAGIDKGRFSMLQPAVATKTDKPGASFETTLAMRPPDPGHNTTR